MMQTEVSDNGVYELGFLLVPQITEEKLPESFSALKSVFLDKGAVVISEESPKMLNLAYTMEKVINNKIERFRDAYFGWVKFEIDPSMVTDIEATLRLRDDVVRHLLIKTVRENTIASKRPFTGARRRSTEGKEKDPNAPEMSKEEIDREIDALVDKKEEVVAEVEA